DPWRTEASAPIIPASLQQTYRHSSYPESWLPIDSELNTKCNCSANHTLLQNEAYIEDIRTKGVMILTPFGKGVGITDIMHQGSRVASLSDK
ncbi:hypothetical protein, partial [Acetobacter pasteurianus]|uniref:hypothetical protein n=1 Tax=Acetobacter pasteurianus TaxID=438 RepID=UPI002492F189